jgi:hypothetical protein
MTIHILDVVMYFVVIVVYWNLLDKMSDGEYTNELGGLVGLLGTGVVTIIYIVLFGVMDWDWINIFGGINPIEWLKLKW